jgi:hypothetical protein
MYHARAYIADQRHGVRDEFPLHVEVPLHHVAAFRSVFSEILPSIL